MKSEEKSDRTNVVNAFFKRLDDRVAEIQLIVFVCGPTVPFRKAKAKLSPATVVRKFVSDKITELGSVVIWGEHFDKRRRPRGNLSFKYFTDADKEMAFADEGADLVIIFPESAGSLAEVGGFSLHSEVAKKMLVVFDRSRKGDKGYVVQAVARAAKSRKALIKYRDYKKLDELWKEVNRALHECKIRKMTSQSYAKV
jgi:hypothetical protein